MSSLMLFLCACYLSQAAAWSMQPYQVEHAEIHFEYFIKHHGKKYVNETEKQQRFEIFKDNLEKVNRMNEEQGENIFGITHIMDLTFEEYLRTYTGLKFDNLGHQEDCPYLTDANIIDVDLPDSFDWRNHGAVTPVKNQNGCGSCYAFSALGNIESLYFIKYKKQIDLSEQQIVDCSTRNAGCDGGHPAAVFRALMPKGKQEYALARATTANPETDDARD